MYQALLRVIRRKISISEFQKQTAFLFISSLIYALSFFSADIILARSLSKELFGFWKHIVLVIQLLIPFFLLGLPESFRFFIAKEGKVLNYFLTVLISLLLITIVSILFLKLGGFEVVIELLKDKYLSTVAFSIPSWLFFLGLNRTLKYFFIQVRKVEYLFFSNLIFVFFLISLALLVSTKLFSLFVLINILITLGFLSSTIYLLFFFLKLQKTQFKNISYLNLCSSLYIKNLLRYGFPLYLSGVSGILTLNIDKILVSKLAGLEQFALYSVGAIEVPLFTLIVSSIIQPVFPKYVELINSNKISEAKQMWINITMRTSFLIYPMIIVLLVLSKKLIVFLYGIKYQDAYKIFSTYLLVAIFRNNSYGIILSAKGQTQWLLFYGVLTAIFNFLFSYILYRQLGIIGVVWGTWISVLIIAILQLSHEGLFKTYVTEFLLNFKIIALLFLIFLTYYFMCLVEK